MDLDGDVLCFHVMPLFQEVFVALMNAIALRVGYPNRICPILFFRDKDLLSHFFGLPLHPYKHVSQLQCLYVNSRCRTQVRHLQRELTEETLHGEALFCFQQSLHVVQPVRNHLLFVILRQNFEKLIMRIEPGTRMLLQHGIDDLRIYPHICI